MPANVKFPNYQMIKQAADRIKHVAYKTPVLMNEYINEKFGAQIYFKCENFQRTGSFKFRGAYNCIKAMMEEGDFPGVIAYSSGNHAQAVALTGKLLGKKSIILMPSDAPEKKVEKTMHHGGVVVRYDRYTENREEMATNIKSKFPGMHIVPSSAHKYIIAGQGTIALELFDEVGQLDHLFVCLGGGGCISGNSISINTLCPECKVWGVEPEGCGDAKKSFDNGQTVTINPGYTICDGAQNTHIDPLTLSIIKKNVTDIFEVKDETVTQAMRFYANHMSMVVEPTGSLALAAILSNHVDIKDKKVGVIVTGGNIDLDLYKRLL